jgi:hypothetical protein
VNQDLQLKSPELLLFKKQFISFGFSAEALFSNFLFYFFSLLDEVKWFVLFVLFLAMTFDGSLLLLHEELRHLASILLSF